jgi:hypothetical protein
VSALAEARSPYSLLDEVERAREVLVLTYTAGLEFFERFALSDARALGAVVTVISDAAMVRADPMVVRRAGTQYLDARAVCPDGAFHPKLLVIVGDGEARVAIGSGNLTMAGWHGNAETWTVLRADGDGGPTALREVSEFLRGLANSSIKLSAGAHAALERVVEQLDALPAEAPGPRVLSSLDGSILSQLPPAAEPVSELDLYAPYHDARLAASRALLDHFRPATWTMYVREDTEIDGEKLAALVRERQGQIAWVSHRRTFEDGSAIADDRFWHGKLIQWRTPGGRWTLTGSPNLSGRALLYSVVEGGNCELAVLAPTTDSLAPAEGDEPAGGAAMLRRPVSDQRDRPAVLLLAAVVQIATVTLQLHQPLASGGVVQFYDLGEDRWRQTATVAAGSDYYELDIAQAPVGRALRIVLDGGGRSNSVFVADLARVRRPQIKAIGKVRGSPEDVAKLGLGNQLLADLDELRPHLLTAGAARAQPQPHPGEESGGSEATEPARPSSGMTLEEFLLACEPVLGQRMTEFALVLPALPGVGEALDDTVGTLDTDEDTDAVEDDEQPPNVTDELNRRTPSERARYRSFMERLISRSPSYPLVVRSLALRTLLHAIGANLWPDEQWPQVLSDALRALAAGNAEPHPSELAAAASLAATGLALLRTDVPKFSRRDEHLIRYEAAGNAVKGLLAHVEPEQVELLAAKDLPGRLAGPTGVLAAQRAVADVLHPLTGPELAVRLLADEHGEAAIVEDGVTIVLQEPVPPFFTPALIRALGLAHDDGPVYVRATTTTGRHVVGGWCRPLLAEEQVGPAGPFGRAWRLLPGEAPSTVDPMDLPPGDYNWAANQPRPPDVEDLLGELDSAALSPP